MSDPAFDIGLLTKPPGPFGSPLMPPRATDLSSSADAPAAGSAAPWLGPNSKFGLRTAQVAPRTMIVGRAVSLSADISFCDRLVVEGDVEASLDECHELKISATGLFKGNAKVANAEISGRFEGDLFVRKQLVIRASGHVCGSITYGELEIERGGKVSGILMHESKNAIPLLPEPAFAKGH
jgi:cytoskeletal protein CcmA (bactofilin family)